MVNSNASLKITNPYTVVQNDKLTFSIVTIIGLSLCLVDKICDYYNIQ